jgi:hypothetical protein
VTAVCAWVSVRRVSSSAPPLDAARSAASIAAGHETTIIRPVCCNPCEIQSAASRPRVPRVESPVSFRSGATTTGIARLAGSMRVCLVVR